MRYFTRRAAAVLCFCFAAALTGCASKKDAVVSDVIVEEDDGSPAAKAVNASLAQIKDIIWLLSEVRVGFGAVSVDRALLGQSSHGDYFTLQFTGDGASGRAAPNRYFAPYAFISGNEIALRPIVSTLEKWDIIIVNALSEKEYYDYLQRINRWAYENGLLYLFSKTDSGSDVVMIFIPQE